MTDRRMTYHELSILALKQGVTIDGLIVEVNQLRETIYNLISLGTGKTINRIWAEAEDLRKKKAEKKS